MPKRMTDPSGYEWMALEQHDLEAWTNKIGMRIMIGLLSAGGSIIFAAIVWYATVNQTLREQQEDIVELRVEGSAPMRDLRHEIDSLRLEIRVLPERIGRQVEASTN